MFKVILTDSLEKTAINVDTGKLPPAKAEEMVFKFVDRYKSATETYWFAKPGDSFGTVVNSWGKFGTLMIDANNVEINSTRCSHIFYNDKYDDKNVVAEIQCQYVVGIIEIK